MLRSSFPTLATTQTKKSGHHTGHDHNRRPMTQLDAIARNMVALNRDWEKAKADNQHARAERIYRTFLKQEANFHFFSAVVEHKRDH